MPNPNPKPPKKRGNKSLSRHSRGSKAKRSSYDIAEARESLGLPATASFQEVNSHSMLTGPNPSLPRSPPKKVVKARLAEEIKKNEILSHKSDVSVREVHAKSRQIQNLKQQVRSLSEALQSERKKSRATVTKLLDDAELVMAEACGIQSESNEKMSSAEDTLIQERQQFRSELCRERSYYAGELAMCKCLFGKHSYDILSYIFFVIVNSYLEYQ